MASLTDEIMGKLRGKKTGPLDVAAETGDTPADEALDEEGSDYAGDKVSAMQDFMDAETAEEKASALEAFILLCKE